MSEKLARKTENLWDKVRVVDLDDLEKLSYRSNLLGTDRSVANFGGGNTSTKTKTRDHTGQEIEVLWVKGSGTDLASIKPHQFTALKLDEVLAFKERDEMDDQEMVSYLSRCQLSPEMPRGSIETLLHAFIDHPHIDHTHPDAINMICCSKDGESLARECFGEEAVWIEYIRPGFTLSKQVAQAVRDTPAARMILLEKHGLVTWGQTHEESYTSTIEAINRAAEFVEEKGRSSEPFGGRKIEPLEVGEREDVLVEILPTLRGALSCIGGGGVAHKILNVDYETHEVLEFVCARDSRELSQVGAACPDHLVRTKVKPLWIPFDPKSESSQTLKERVEGAVSDYRSEYEAYFSRYSEGDEEMFDPNPRVVLIEGMGLVSAARNEKEATLSRDFYLRAIGVMRGAHALGGYVSLSESESYAVEYWPMELYKLSLAPPPTELAGEVALVTGGAGGIGSAVCRSLAGHGACVVVSDKDGSGASEVAAALDESALAIASDVSREEEVREMYRRAVLEYGGVDIVVSNAGFAYSAPIEETPVERWDEVQAVLLRGYFLVSREAFRVFGEQKSGGSLVFVASKNGLLSGKNNAAYASAKAGEMHLARCLAEEGGERGIRVNTVNPDAVIRGTKLWDSGWKEARASSYGIGVDDLEAHYRERTALKVNIEPEDLTEAVLFFASDARSAKSTGNILNVDGGVRDAYPR